MLMYKRYLRLQVNRINFGKQSRKSVNPLNFDPHSPSTNSGASTLASSIRDANADDPPPPTPDLIVSATHLPDVTTPQLVVNAPNETNQTCVCDSIVTDANTPLASVVPAPPGQG